MALVGDILDFVVDRMQIDAAWSVRDDESLTWWPSLLAQRVWASPARDLQGIPVTTLHIQSDLLADVAADDATWERLAAVNRFAALSAYVAHPAIGTVSLHASVSLTNDNWPMARALALHAIALQAADAHHEAHALADAFGARVATSAHPTQGPRDTPDDMLGVVEIYQQRGEDDSPFTSEELAQLVHLEPRPWTMASNELHRLDADVGFVSGTSARLELDAADRHPALGSGLRMRLRLPIEPDAAVAQRLNASECLEPDAHQVGGWCVDEAYGLMFTGFVPAGVHMPGLSRALAYHMAARADWARALLFPSA